MPDDIEVVRRYHTLTKHSFKAYAPSPGFLDRDAQPNPFRRYNGAQRIALPRPSAVPDLLFNDLYSGVKIDPAVLSLENIALLFEYSLGLSAWKTTGFETWSLRINPSSGNLHPTEAYLLLFKSLSSDLPAGVYHYSSYDHTLEQLGSISSLALKEGAPGISSDTQKQTFGAVILTSIHWREEWKYGARAFRYCQHDVGHAYASLAMAAKLNGWQAKIDPDIDDATLADLLQLGSYGEPAAELEAPDLLIFLSLPSAVASNTVKSQASAGGSTAFNWIQLKQAIAPIERPLTSNKISSEHVAWPLVEKVASACERHKAHSSDYLKAPWHATHWLGSTPNLLCKDQAISEAPPAAKVIKKRRSAQRMHKGCAMDREQFYAMLSHCLPNASQPVLSGFPFHPAINFMIFVHAVKGLEPGLYTLLRCPNYESSYRNAFAKQQSNWLAISDSGLPLYRVNTLPQSREASRLSCYQGIAGHGAFTVSMLANMSVLHHEGAWAYRRLFWEAGMLGQLLYLDAESIDCNGTGIGCYFDNETLQHFGLEEEGDWQVVYHFAVGKALVDQRLTTLSAYHHLQTEQENTYE